MRTSIAAVAIIRRASAAGEQWLAQWNSGWEAFSWIGGHKRENETFFECLIREIVEELQLQPGEHFTAAAEPLVHAQYTAWSERARVETSYSLQLFAVQLTAAAEQLADRSPQNRWLTRAEIESQRTLDGKRVSPTMQALLTKMQPERNIADHD
jgi:8-oxo-dGTP pyrophosphatase MutT (NUDIX family)